MATQAENFDPLVDEVPRRYVVGIDLGTTNSAVSYVDTRASAWKVRSLKIPQLVAFGQVEQRATLPSFHYQATQAEIATGGLQLPWSHADDVRDWAVGIMARDEGTKSPGRLIASAKSWLCHTGVDRTAELLPWQAADDVRRLSPVTSSARYLGHIRDTWNARFPKEVLADQDIVITLPASFDEVARELTVAAAAEADLPRVVLIEEPQAAFYAWVHKHSDDWYERVTPGHKILVCDIGGGTSDFTLINVEQVQARRKADRVQFHRVAVGDHLILGGDNLDLALAHHIEARISGGKKLTPRQWGALIGNCRRVKETLLGKGAPESATVNIPGGGSRLIGGSLSTEVTRHEAIQVLVEGFLPKVSATDRPASGQSGFREFGLPYASDPAITKHLTAFLRAHRDAEAGEDPNAARPDVVLFNGGFFASPALRQRLLQVISSWFTTDQGEPWEPIVLDNDRLDLAVSRGAAYYGMVRRGAGVRIAANLARSYYIGVENGNGGEHSVVCLVPGNAAAGQDIELTSRRFELTISEPVEFSLYVSSTRLTDEPGQILPIDPEQMKPLPPIRTVLRTKRKSERGTVPVTLHAHLSEIGTIDLSCRQVDSDRRWRLQFDIRSTTETDRDAHTSAGETQGFVDDAAWGDCEKLIAGVFGAGGKDKPGGLAKRLAGALDMPRGDWPPTLLRRIWENLMQLEPGRRRSLRHEERWLNLLGYALRPGYGLAVDDWRVAETWRGVRNKLAHRGPSVHIESLILWRRISGGLSSGQQTALAEPLISSLRIMHKSSMTGRAQGKATLALHESAEAWRLIGSLELLGVDAKTQIGDMIVDLLPKRRYEKVRDPMVWALGRLGQRIPMYGPLNTVIPPAKVEPWLKLILDLDPTASLHQLAAMQLARRTDDRYRDVDDDLRDKVIGWLERGDARKHLIELVRAGGQLASDEQNQVFGEALPKGLRLAL